MGVMKQFLEAVASEMGELDISKPEVVAEAKRQLRGLLEERETEELLEFFGG